MSSPADLPEQPVLFRTLNTQSNKKIAIATLNAEKSLNALNLDMVKRLTQQLALWKQDNDIAIVILEGAGSKAFCAGGDVLKIQQASLKQPEEISFEALRFFSQEYRLDFAIHQFGKPIIIWGDGIVMGGGMGLMMGGSHRIVTENSKLAMPEVTIGLYPDVGGSYFLNRMPSKMGLFLGLTGYLLTAADAIYVGMANHFMSSKNKQNMLETLCQQNWHDDIANNHQQLTNALNEHSSATYSATNNIEQSTLKSNQALITELMDGSLNDIIDRMLKLETHEKWLLRAKNTLLAGSPLSWYMIYQQSLMKQALDLASCFQLELGWSVNCCAYGDFAEGVRALLIDKDKSPKWKYGNLNDIPDLVKEQLMSSPWPHQQHPLKDLYN